MTSINNANGKTIVNLFIFIFSIYFLTASIINYTDVAQLRIDVIKSFIKSGELSVPSGIKGVGGRYYSWFGIGSPLLGLPFYIVGLLTGINPEVLVSSMNLFFSAATVVVIFLFLKVAGYSYRICLLVSIVYGLGTIAWPQAKVPFDHAIETFFITLSFYFMYYPSDRNKSILVVLSGISVGFAFITRASAILAIPSLLLLLVTYVFSLSRPRINKKLLLKDIILFFLAFIPFLFLSSWYNYYRFGSFFESGYGLIAARIGFSNFRISSFFMGLKGLLISPGKGLFYYSPAAILFFFSLKSFTKKHMSLGISFVMFVLLYLFLYSTYKFWHGDFAWGPRYIFPITPFLLIPIAELVHNALSQKKKVLQLIMALAFGLSIVVQLIAVSVDFQKYFGHLHYVENIQFTIHQADGVQNIQELPAYIYDDYRYSPILYQFKFIYQISAIIKDYINGNNSDKNPIKSDIKSLQQQPLANSYDFWWLHKYFIEGTRSGFIAAALLVLIIIHMGIKLWEHDE